MSDSATNEYPIAIIVPFGNEKDKKRRDNDIPDGKGEKKKKTDVRGRGNAKESRNTEEEEREGHDGAAVPTAHSLKTVTIYLRCDAFAYPTASTANVLTAGSSLSSSSPSSSSTSSGKIIHYAPAPAIAETIQFALQSSKQTNMNNDNNKSDDNVSGDAKKTTTLLLQRLLVLLGREDEITRDGAQRNANLEGRPKIFRSRDSFPPRTYASVADLEAGVEEVVEHIRRELVSFTTTSNNYQRLATIFSTELSSSTAPELIKNALHLLRGGGAATTKNKEEKSASDPIGRGARTRETKGEEHGSKQSKETKVEGEEEKDDLNCVFRARYEPSKQKLFFVSCSDPTDRRWKLPFNATYASHAVALQADDGKHKKKEKETEKEKKVKKKSKEEVAARKESKQTEADEDWTGKEDANEEKATEGRNRSFSRKTEQEQTPPSPGVVVVDNSKQVQGKEKEANDMEALLAKIEAVALNPPTTSPTSIATSGRLLPIRNDWDSNIDTLRREEFEEIVGKAPSNGLLRTSPASSATQTTNEKQKRGASTEKTRGGGAQRLITKRSGSNTTRTAVRKQGIADESNISTQPKDQMSETTQSLISSAAAEGRAVGKTDGSHVPLFSSQLLAQQTPPANEVKLTATGDSNKTLSSHENSSTKNNREAHHHEEVACSIRRTPPHVKESDAETIRDFVSEVMDKVCDGWVQPSLPDDNQLLGDDNRSHSRLREALLSSSLFSSVLPLKKNNEEEEEYKDDPIVAEQIQLMRESYGLDLDEGLSDESFFEKAATILADERDLLEGHDGFSENESIKDSDNNRGFVGEGYREIRHNLAVSDMNAIIELEKIVRSTVEMDEEEELANHFRKLQSLRKSKEREKGEKETIKKAVSHSLVFTGEVAGKGSASETLTDVSHYEDPTAITANATDEELQEMSQAASVLQSKFRKLTLSRKHQKTSELEAPAIKKEEQCESAHKNQSESEIGLEPARRSMSFGEADATFEDPTAITANATDEELQEMSQAASVLQSKFRKFTLSRQKKTSALQPVSNAIESPTSPQAQEESTKEGQKKVHAGDGVSVEEFNAVSSELIELEDPTAITANATNEELQEMSQAASVLQSKFRKFTLSRQKKTNLLTQPEISGGNNDVIEKQHANNRDAYIIKEGGVLEDSKTALMKSVETRAVDVVSAHIPKHDNVVLPMSNLPPSSGSPFPSLPLQGAVAAELDQMSNDESLRRYALSQQQLGEWLAHCSHIEDLLAKVRGQKERSIRREREEREGREEEEREMARRAQNAAFSRALRSAEADEISSRFEIENVGEVLEWRTLRSQAKASAHLALESFHIRFRAEREIEAAKECNALFLTEERQRKLIIFDEERGWAGDEADCDATHQALSSSDATKTDQNPEKRFFIPIPFRKREFDASLFDAQQRGQLRLAAEQEAKRVQQIEMARMEMRLAFEGEEELGRSVIEETSLRAFEEDIRLKAANERAFLKDLAYLVDEEEEGRALLASVQASHFVKAIVTPFSDEHLAAAVATNVRVSKERAANAAVEAEREEERRRILRLEQDAALLEQESRQRKIEKEEKVKEEQQQRMVPPVVSPQQEAELIEIDNDTETPHRILKSPTSTSIRAGGIEGTPIQTSKKSQSSVTTTPNTKSEGRFPTPQPHLSTPSSSMPGMATANGDTRSHIEMSSAHHLPHSSSSFATAVSSGTDVTWSRSRRALVENIVMTAASSDGTKDKAGGATAKDFANLAAIVSARGPMQIGLSKRFSLYDGSGGREDVRGADLDLSSPRLVPRWQFPFAVASLGLSRGFMRFEMRLDFKLRPPTLFSSRSRHNQDVRHAMDPHHEGEYNVASPSSTYFTTPLAYVGVASKYFSGKSSLAETGDENGMAEEAQYTEDHEGREGYDERGGIVRGRGRAQEGRPQHPREVRGFFLRTTDGALVTSLDPEAPGVPYATVMPSDSVMSPSNGNVGKGVEEDHESQIATIPSSSPSRNRFIPADGGSSACLIGVIVDLSPHHPHMRFSINGYDCGEAFSFIGSIEAGTFEPLFPTVVFTAAGDSATFVTPAPAVDRVISHGEEKTGGEVDEEKPANSQLFTSTLKNPHTRRRVKSIHENEEEALIRPHHRDQEDTTHSKSQAQQQDVHSVYDESSHIIRGHQHIPSRVHTSHITMILSPSPQRRQLVRKYGGDERDKRIQEAPHGNQHGAGDRHFSMPSPLPPPRAPVSHSFDPTSRSSPSRPLRMDHLSLAQQDHREQHERREHQPSYPCAYRGDESQKLFEELSMIAREAPTASPSPERRTSPPPNIFSQRVLHASKKSDGFETNLPHAAARGDTQQRQYIPGSAADGGVRRGFEAGGVGQEHFGNQRINPAIASSVPLQYNYYDYDKANLSNRPPHEHHSHLLAAIRNRERQNAHLQRLYGVRAGDQLDSVHRGPSRSAVRGPPPAALVSSSEPGFDNNAQHYRDPPFMHSPSSTQRPQTHPATGTNLTDIYDDGILFRAGSQYYS